MSLRRTSYSTPSSTAGVLSVGKGTTGGIKMSPKFVMVVAIVFIVLVIILGYALPV